MVANFCARWRAELAIQHDGLGIVSLPLSYGQLGIIAQHGSDTHQDAIVQAAKLMGKASGLWPAKTERLSGPGSDAAVPALSITQRDKRSVRREKAAVRSRNQFSTCSFRLMNFFSERSCLIGHVQQVVHPPDFSNQIIRIVCVDKIFQLHPLTDCYTVSLQR